MAFKIEYSPKVTEKLLELFSEALKPGGFGPPSAADARPPGTTGPGAEAARKGVAERLWHDLTQWRKRIERRIASALSFDEVGKPFSSYFWSFLFGPGNTDRRILDDEDFRGCPAQVWLTRIPNPEGDVVLITDILIAPLTQRQD